MLFGKLLPREGNFFDMFNEHGKHIAEGARAFQSMVQNYADETTTPRNRPTASPPTATGCCTRPSSRRSTASRSTA
jgi:hypothetical protein